MRRPGWTRDLRWEAESAGWDRLPLLPSGRRGGGSEDGAWKKHQFSFSEGGGVAALSVGSDVAAKFVGHREVLYSVIGVKENAETACV